MLKALIKSLEDKHLNPRILEPFLPTDWEKNLMILHFYGKFNN
jgi:hypothetical protein